MPRLPEPVQRYLRRVGVLGRAPVKSVHTTFDATLFRAPGGNGMRGPAHQIDVIDPPRRIFYMETRMFGLPVKVLHDYNGAEATMRVRLANLFDVVNLSGPVLSKVETVTMLNDLVLFAPSALLGPAFDWLSIDAEHAQVTWTNGPYQVSAVLTVNADGDLVTFRSEDRGEVTADTEIVPMPWETPVSGFTSFDGRRVPGRGDAVWLREDGAFTYGIFLVTDVAFDSV